MRELVRKAFLESARVKEAFLSRYEDEVVKLAELVAERLRAGGKVLLFGNGGSAADAQHIAAELVGRFKKERGALPAVALTTDSSVLTAVGNDYGFELVFERQVEALCRPGDVAIGITTSGNSPNVIRGLLKARQLGALTVAFTGRDGGKVKEVAELVFIVPSDETPRIQECHVTLGHALCELIDELL
ncbi:MAG: D-sedoheptulose 7-phosphate isomerase [Aquificae bacterium]|nr:D-sedoheptulose 7-phosphate isomerase [Aquificota bacterium]